MSMSLHDNVSFAHGPAMKNRFMLAPLTNQQSHDDGKLSEDEYHWLMMRAQGGFGLTMTCAASVQEVGRGFAGQLGCHDDHHIEGLSRLARDMKAANTLAIVQLHHAGNRSPRELIGTDPVCPSDDPETGARAMSTEEVEQLIVDFVAAAVRCDKAGFDGVELHGAHGYMICQFLSSELNKRTDKYGGSLENRARVLMSVVDGVRSSCRSDFNLSVRLSPERFGMKIDEIREVFGWLVDGKKIDFIDMSLWDVFKEPIEEGHKGKRLVDIFAALPRGDVRLGAAGKLYSAADSQRAIDAGLDIAVIGRGAIANHDFAAQSLADPHFAMRDLPIPRQVLRDEGLSEIFVNYMGNWPGFVAE
jgi:2,4-dienoyl-CoA reductase-like NADH-dependent reductase (Old Yellow Enzyme family)